MAMTDEELKAAEHRYKAAATAEIDALRSERDCARGHAAAMRAALEELASYDHSSTCDSEVRRGGTCDCTIAVATRALAGDAGKGWLGPDVVAKVRDGLKAILDYNHTEECEGNPDGYTHSELDCGHQCAQCPSDDEDCPAHDIEACFLTHCDCSLGPPLRALALLGGKGER